jgi:hypothetical protein
MQLLKHDRIRVLVSSSGMDATFAAKASPDPILKQVLLDVGRVERGDFRAARFDPRADSLQGLGPAEIPDRRHDQVVLLQRAHSSIVVFAREVRAGQPGAVRLCLELRERG